MEEVQKRIYDCIINNSIVLDLSGLGLEELPNNLPDSLQELYCSNNKYLHLPKEIATRFNIKETVNYNKMASVIQNRWKLYRRIKRLKFCKQLHEHFNEIRYRPNFGGYLELLNDNNQYYNSTTKN